MELRDFAEQVLFATTLEEKLRRPSVVTDDQPGPPRPAPVLPGRPAELRFKAAGDSQADFPGLHRLEQERERGRLLHFFANHELLATELMALVLLRFPEAPKAFRRGVLQTLLEEQDHTRLYLRRMAQCGLQFGELPVSGYFWRAVSPMTQPMDFVAGLSLTFEQANLDFCRHFSRGFAAVGDPETAALLDGIYRDEIGHVAHGLKWFRRWKDPGESDWEAFRRQLKFPLSPQRAKGFELNVEGRRSAGLDPEFIAELEVFSQSKGRTPHVFWFNPFAEAVLARGSSFTPVKAQAALAHDLAALPQFLARQDDVVLVPQRPSAPFLSGLKQTGFPLPEFVELEGHGGASPLLELSRRKLAGLRPWAWGPDSLRLLEPLFGSVTGDRRPPEESFNATLARLYSKAWSAAFLREVLEGESTLPDGALPTQSWLCARDDVGVEVRTVPEALDRIAAWRAQGMHRLVAKESLGLAGANSLRLWEPELLPAQLQWLTSALRDGRTVVIEPWRERVVDFSVQWEMQSRRLKLCGFTGLLVDRRGQYLGNWAEPHSQRLPSAVLGLFPQEISRGLPALFERIRHRLEIHLRDGGFRGPVGMDAFVYRESDGTARLKPVVEINPRFTLGRVLLELMRRVAPGSQGRLELINTARLRKEGFADFARYDRALRERHPVRIEGEPVGRLREGAVSLNDPATAQVCLAVFEVSRTRL